MVSMLNAVAAEAHPLAGWEWTSPWHLWRQSLPQYRYLRMVEDRIRHVFCLGLADPLPLVRQNTLRVYYAHLASVLVFPFRASHCEEMEPLVLDGSVIANSLCDPARTPLDSGRGILCEVTFRNAAKLPLHLESRTRQS